MVKYLLSNENINVNHPNKAQHIKTPLCAAIEKKKEIINLLLSNENIDVNLQSILNYDYSDSRIKY